MGLWLTTFTCQSIHFHFLKQFHCGRTYPAQLIASTI